MRIQKDERAKIGARLQAARERAHITIEDAAEAVGVQPIAIRRWEKGTALPTLVELRLLLPSYGVIACEILFEENPWALPQPLAAELRRAAEHFSPQLRGHLEVYMALHAKGVEPVFRQAS